MTMKCFVLVAVFMTTAVFFGQSEEMDKKPGVEETELAQEIQTLINDLHGGLSTSVIDSRLDEIIAHAKAIDCGEAGQVDEAQLEALIDRVVEAIKSHGKLGQLEAQAEELNRGFYLLDGLAEYLADINNENQDNVCDVIAVIWGTAQTIRDNLEELGETTVTFNFDDDAKSGNSKRKVCIGVRIGKFCGGLGWGRR